MAVLMFWNTGKKADGEAIGALCREYDVDILLLTETETAGGHLVPEINGAASRRQTFWELPRRGSRIRVFTHYAPGALRPAFDDGRVRMLNLHPPLGRPLLIVTAHLPSKLWANGQDQAYRVRLLRQDIIRQEHANRHRNTIIIGDLNANPFDGALTAADGLHAVMDKFVASRSPRTVQGQPWDYFYNPMWSRIGDESAGPPGTYWRAGSSLVEHFWNTFDQVLLRPELLTCYHSDRLVVPDRVGDRLILGRGEATPGLSDHLPVVIGLNIESEIEHGREFLGGS